MLLLYTSQDNRLKLAPAFRDFHLISSRGKELLPGADAFTSFLESYIATWGFLNTMRT